MSETTVSTREIFDSEDFDCQFTELQFRDEQLQVQDDHLDFALRSAFRHVRQGYGRSVAVDLAKERIEILPVEELDDTDIPNLKPGLIEIIKAFKTAKQVRNTARSDFISLGQQIGMNDFALYGLDRRLRHGTPSSRLTLRDDVLETEQRFKSLDDLLRANSGKAVTLLDVASANTAILGSGGIRLPNGHLSTVARVSTETSRPLQARFAASSILNLSNLEINADRIAQGEIRTADPAEFLRLSNWWFSNTITIGEIPEGPLYFDETNLRRSPYHFENLDLIRRANRLVIDRTQIN